MKSGEKIGGIELTNQENIRALGEKENFNFLRILEANTIDQTEMKKMSEKRISKELENLLTLSSSKE